MCLTAETLAVIRCIKFGKHYVRAAHVIIYEKYINFNFYKV